MTVWADSTEFSAEDGIGQLILVRHGSTDWSGSGRHTGRTDIDLDEQGKQTARALSVRLESAPITVVLSSPLRRARETCELAGFGSAMQLVDDLMEWHYGDYEGKTTPEIRLERPGWDLFHEGCPQGEVAEQVGARVRSVLGALPIDSEGKNAALLFAHGHVLRVLAACYLGLGPEAGALFMLDPATICVLGHERETRVLRVWNS